MKVKDIEQQCLVKEQELLDKYFDNIVLEAANEIPETIGAYNEELPNKVVAEYFDFLKELFAKVAPDESRSLDVIMDKRKKCGQFTEDEREDLKKAQREAKRITLWEKITKSNHEDVTYYKGLLKAYTQELLEWKRIDFIEGTH